MFNKEKILPKLFGLPEKPGVYIMYSADGQIIYVGKAINLKRRVTQYFRNSVKPTKVRVMVDNVDDLEYFVTLTEEEALTLESTLIKKHLPRYNILLKDDKGLGAYIRIDESEPFPSVQVVRRQKKDGARYYGPFSGALNAYAVIKIIKAVYGIRVCRKLSSRRECLDGHIGLCLCPCVNRVSKSEYDAALKKAQGFLSGNCTEAEKIISEKMTAAAENEDFERAIDLRYLLETVKKLGERTLAGLAVGDVDIFAYITDGIKSAVAVMPVRGNKLIPLGCYPSTDASDDSEAISSFIMQYYSHSPVPREILINTAMDFAPLEGCLSAIRGGAVSIKRPMRGQKRDLILIAEENARQAVLLAADKEQRRQEQTYGACERLCELLRLKSARRIECYDISHISGTDKVASGVCFINGEKAPAEYRRYKIKTVEGNDDFSCMAEVISRRLNRAKEGDQSFSELPDLLLIDGGKGQLSAALAACEAAGFSLPIAALAEKREEIFLPDRADSIILPRDSAPLKLLCRVRDEAHRFAVTYHRNLRRKRIRSVLLDIVGMGEKKCKLLLSTFGSVSKIKELPLAVLESVKGMTKPSARAVYLYFHPEGIEQ